KKAAPIFSGPSEKLKHPGARFRQGRNPTAEGSHSFFRDSGNAEHLPLSPAALGLSCAAMSRHCGSLRRLEKSPPSKKSHYNLRPFIISALFIISECLPSHSPHWRGCAAAGAQMSP